MPLKHDFEDAADYAAKSSPLTLKPIIQLASFRAMSHIANATVLLWISTLFGSKPWFDNVVPWVHLKLRTMSDVCRYSTTIECYQCIRVRSLRHFSLLDVESLYERRSDPCLQVFTVARHISAAVVAIFLLSEAFQLRCVAAVSAQFLHYRHNIKHAG